MIAEPGISVWVACNVYEYHQNENFIYKHARGWRAPNGNQQQQQVGWKAICLEIHGFGKKKRGKTTSDWERKSKPEKGKEHLTNNCVYSEMESSSWHKKKYELWQPKKGMAGTMINTTIKSHAKHTNNQSQYDSIQEQQLHHQGRRHHQHQHQHRHRTKSDSF